MMKTVAYLVTAGLLAASTAFAGPVEMTGQLPGGTFVACDTEEAAIELAAYGISAETFESGRCGLFDQSMRTHVIDPDAYVSQATISSPDGYVRFNAYVLPEKMQAVGGRPSLAYPMITGLDVAAVCNSPDEAKLLYEANRRRDNVTVTLLFQRDRCTLVEAGYQASLYGEDSATLHVHAVDPRGVVAAGYIDSRFPVTR